MGLRFLAPPADSASSSTADGSEEAGRVQSKD